MSQDNAKSKLQEWAKAGKLSSAKLADDGSTLALGETTLPASTVLSVSHAGKSCSYSAASIYLQLLDPDQGLLPYRNKCKKHGVKDPVKALDKPVILGFFLGLSTGLASEAPTAASASAATAAAPPPASRESASKSTDRGSDSGDKSSRHHKKKDRKRSSSSSGHRHHHSSSHKRHRESSPGSPSRKPRKEPKGLVSNEQLISNLNVVVDKRQDAMDDKRQQDITLALSATGFDVTPELLEEHKEKTQAILAKEIPVGNSASILRAVNPRKDLSRVLELFQEAVQPAGRKSGSGGKLGSGSGGGGSGSSRHHHQGAGNKHAAKPVRKHLIGKKPIIIVPKGMIGVITLANAHEFLANARFVPRDVVVKQGKHRSPPTNFTRTVRSTAGTTGLLEYEIMDNPRKLQSKQLEWDRVVAVIVLGQAWQFKDWLAPLYNAPATLFAKVFGYYVGMESEKDPPEIKGWAVQSAKLNRDKRGLDQIAYASFWSGLDEFMRVHKPELLPQDE